MFRQWHIISPTQACKVGWKVPASWGRLNCCTQPWLIAMAFETPLERCQALERFGSCTSSENKTCTATIGHYGNTAISLWSMRSHLLLSVVHLPIFRGGFPSFAGPASVRIGGQVLLVNVGDMSTIVRSSLIQFSLVCLCIGLSATRLLSHKVGRKPAANINLHQFFIDVKSVFRANKHGDAGTKTVIDGWNPHLCSLKWGSDTLR